MLIASLATPRAAAAALRRARAHLREAVPRGAGAWAVLAGFVVLAAWGGFAGMSYLHRGPVADLRAALPTPPGAVASFRPAGIPAEQAGAALRVRAGEVDDLVARTSTVRASVSGLRARLAGGPGRDGAPRGRLAWDLRQIHDRLSEIDGRGLELRADVDRLAARLASLERSGVQLLDAAGFIRSLSAIAERARAVEQDRQEMTRQFAEATERSIGSVERQLALIGLDPARLLGAELASGGPFVPLALDGRAGLAGEEAAASTRLERSLGHWDRLRRALERIPFAQPMADAQITSGFGPRIDPFLRRLAKHEGVDFVGSWRAAVVATAPGRVVFAGRNGGYGNSVEIDHGMGIKTRYAHLHLIVVKEGQEVRPGAMLGQMGNTGRSTGAHLHYEILVDDEPYDPMRFLRAGNDVYKG